MSSIQTIAQIACAIVGAGYGIAALVKHLKKPTLCDRCEYLERKGGNLVGNTRYTTYSCANNKVYPSNFDGAPTYCAYFEPKEADK